jgi:hypothetical protein
LEIVCFKKKKDKQQTVSHTPTNAAVVKTQKNDQSYVFMLIADKSNLQNKHSVMVD